MTVLLVTNLAQDFSCNFNDTATTAARDTNYSPSSMSFGNSNQDYVLNIPSFTGDLWIHMRHYCSNNGLSSPTNTPFKLLDASGNVVASFARIISQEASQAISARAFGSSTVRGADWTWGNGTHTFDFKISVGTSGNPIVVEMYVSGTLVSTATATNSGTVKGLPTKLVFNTTYGNADIYLSEVIVTANEDTRAMRLSTLVPASNGSDTGWTGGFAGLADLDMSSGAYAASSGLRSSWNPTTYTGAGSPIGIRGVFLKARVAKAGTGLSKLGQYIKISGTNYDGTDQTITGDPLMEEFANNPATSAPWTVAALTAQFGIKSAT